MSRQPSWFVIGLLAVSSVSAQPRDIGPAPGRLIDVGGRRLHLDCRGTGSPTVILESGASSFAIDWALVQPDVARRTRVCSYDRAGSGWSDPRPSVDTPARIVADLHELLAAAVEKPPFVVVGASWGGIYARLFQLAHPGDVAGMVFVDASTEDGLFAMFEGKGVTIASLTAEQLRTTLPSAPVAVPRRPPQTGSPFDRLPPDFYALRIEMEQRLIDSVPPMVPADVVREAAEGQRAALATLAASGGRVDPARITGPVVVLTRGDLPGNAQDLLTRLSPNSRRTVVTGAGHEIHMFAPAVVVQAIDDVVTAVRQGSALPVRQP